jgi:hypothetical protein
VLRAWITNLAVPRGVLRAVDENNNEVNLNDWDEVSVYVKYNSSDNGDAYMKPYKGEYFGVLFQPLLTDGEFRQYGDLPLSTFE